jgi:hypothetical protein
MPYTYDFHGILSVETTEKLLGTATHRYFLTDESLDPDVRVETDADFDVDTADLQRHDLWFYGADGRDLVYYEDTLFGRTDKVLLEDLKKETTTIRANTIDRITPRSRGSVSDLLEVVIDYKLIQRGYTTLHAGALSHNGRGVLLGGFPNVGKTLSTLSLLDVGFSYLSDDNTIIGADGTVSAHPSTSSVSYRDFRRFFGPEEFGHIGYYGRLARLFPMQFAIAERVLDHPSLYLPDVDGVTQADSADAMVACTLEIGPRETEEVAADTLARKLITSTDYSRPRPWQHPFVWVYAYFNDLDVDAVRNEERRVVRSFLSDASCYRLACEERDWDDVLEGIVGGL